MSVSRWWPCPHTAADGDLTWLVESDDRYVARIRRTGKDDYSVGTTKDRRRAQRFSHDGALIVAVLMQEREWDRRTSWRRTVDAMKGER